MIRYPLRGKEDFKIQDLQAPDRRTVLLENLRNTVLFEFRQPLGILEESNNIGDIRNLLNLLDTLDLPKLPDFLVVPYNSIQLQ